MWNVVSLFVCKVNFQGKDSALPSYVRQRDGGEGADCGISVCVVA